MSLKNKFLTGIVILPIIALGLLIKFCPERIPIKRTQIDNYDIIINSDTPKRISVSSKDYSIKAFDFNHNNRFDSGEIQTNFPEGHALERYANPETLNLIYEEVRENKK